MNVKTLNRHFFDGNLVMGHQTFLSNFHHTLQIIEGSWKNFNFSMRKTIFAQSLALAQTD